MDSNSHDKRIAFLTIGVNPDTVQTIAIRCRCGLRWTERIPKEIHDSEMQVILTCAKCGARFVLQDKQLHRVVDGPQSGQQVSNASKEDATHDGRHKTTELKIGIPDQTDTSQYDA